ncbi:uncharacterized protein LOC143600854 [Bidens hawaiensis]|uniref:uncharacterized protein LOC143600854 n=1 Tax=Bidens hawaiensis TaxID=980011 RepID=UPI0040493B05
MGRADPPTRQQPLYKHNSWSPDIVRDEEWLRRKQNHRRSNKSVTDEDIDELKACIELGFGFSESNDRLSNTLPALGLYYAVNKQYNDTVSKSPLVTSPDSSSLFARGDDPRIMKTRLRQWAQVVACSVRQSSSSPLSSL